MPHFQSRTSLHRYNRPPFLLQERYLGDQLHAIWSWIAPTRGFFLREDLWSWFPARKSSHPHYQAHRVRRWCRSHAIVVQLSDLCYLLTLVVLGKETD